MANRQLVIGANAKHISSFWQGQPYAFGEGNALFTPYNHGEGSGEIDEGVVNSRKGDFDGLSPVESHDHGLDQRNDEKCALGLEQDHGLEEIPDDTQKDDVNLSNDENALVCYKREDGEISLYLENEYGIDQDCIESNDLQLALADEKNELDLSESHGSVDFSFAPVIQSWVVPAPDYELHIGQEFPDVQSCRRALRDTAIALHFEMQTVKSDKTRFTAKCASEGCPWRIHASKFPDVPTFAIRTLNNNHTCGGITHPGHQQASVEWVASSVKKRLRENPDCKPKEILEEIHRAHGITLSYKQAWRGKERILAAVRGSFEEEYRLLPQYCDQIRRTNPGSVATVYGNPEDNCFQLLFISFHASTSGFLRGCRPLIGLDRAVLKSKYLGTLLVASSFDGDGALFPLAFGVVAEESDGNWMWFLSELHSLLESNTKNMPRLTILSDRQKGIIEAVEFNFPNAFHGFWLQHLVESFSKVHSNATLVNLLWEAALALTVVEFEAKLLEIESTSPDAAYWIRSVPPRLWATAYFEGSRLGLHSANIADWILEASTLPIIQMMEHIRRQLMMWFNDRREASMQRTSLLVPTAERQVLEAIEGARSHKVSHTDETKFSVVSNKGTNIIDIRNRNCSCNSWQMQGLPCSHAVAALLSCRHNVYLFADSCFTVNSYRNAYSETIHPIPDRSLWGETAWAVDNGVLEIKLNPPKLAGLPARQRKQPRVHDVNQGCGKRVVHCSRCNQIGHFRTTCTAPI